MFKSNLAKWAVILCFALLGAGCGGDDSPTAPTPTTPEPEPEPEPVTITGDWHGEFEGNLVAGEAFAMLEQNGMDVTGEWSAPMPAALMAVSGRDDELQGPVTGTVMDSTAELEFAFLAVFHPFVGPDCHLHVDVEMFTEDELEGTWHTEDCLEHVVDEGTLDMHKD